MPKPYTLKPADETEISGLMSKYGRNREAAENARGAIRIYERRIAANGMVAADWKSYAIIQEALRRVDSPGIGRPGYAEEKARRAALYAKKGSPNAAK